MFSGKAFVIRVDEATTRYDDATLFDDLHVLAERGVRPIIVAPGVEAAHTLVRRINRSANVAISLSGSDAALLPSAHGGVGTVQVRILNTLTGAGFIPVIEPTAFDIFDEHDAALAADDVAAAIGAACDTARAIFFHEIGGVQDPATHETIAELTPAETLLLADDARVREDLRSTMRAAALSVRGGIPAAQIVDGRVAHALVVEVLTAHHLGTQVTGAIYR
jgi:acetylglutamate kinase